VKFLIEHANFNENDMENFVIRLKGINNKESITSG
jgi:hypothetical protein